MPGSYNIALVAGGNVVETRQMRIVMDPAVQMADAQHRRYNEILMDLHDMQRRGTEASAPLNALYPQVTEIAGKIKDMANVPAQVKTQFESFNKEFDAVRAKFGVPSGGAGAGVV